MNCFVVNIGKSDFYHTYNLQKKLLFKLKQNPTSAYLLILEHKPVITLGRGADKNNILVSDEFLKSRCVQTVKTDRGGGVTYHGPGQFIFYPIIPLKGRIKDIKKYLAVLEETIIELLLKNKIYSYKIDGKRGVWTDKGKIASIGIGITRWIAFHGISLNVDYDMEPFTWINPCGLKNIKITSMLNFLNQIDKDLLKNDFVKILCKKTGLVPIFDQEILNEQISCLA